MIVFQIAVFEETCTSIYYYNRGVNCTGSNWEVIVVNMKNSLGIFWEFSSISIATDIERYYWYKLHMADCYV